MIKEAKIHSGKLAQDRANVFQNSGILNSFNSHKSEACIFIGEREEKVSRGRVWGDGSQISQTQQVGQKRV